VALLVEGSTIDVLVVGYVVTDVPLLLDMVEISPELWTAGISLLEGEVLPQIYGESTKTDRRLGEVLTFVEELVDGCVTVDTRSWIAVPVPDTTRGGTFLVDLDTVAK